DRRARMVCVLALGIPGSEPRIELFEGLIDGVIAAQRRGSGGFGYDPVFEVADGRTTAEMPEGEKDSVSHRGLAVAAATPRLVSVPVTSIPALSSSSMTCCSSSARTAIPARSPPPWRLIARRAAGRYRSICTLNSST
ncbi:MAG: non-canonical purine NTP pyrophosphatase, partial [Actinobacteria bacterium]|nr:non-canonical purine NTP pyrophosphatase [Actinomycetota bacterium]